jgi:hypothetical protein
MSVPITNNEMLLQVIGGDMVKVIDDVSEDILERIKEVVNLNVYELYPEGQYERLGENGGFLGAWEKEAAVLIGNYIESKIGINPSLMTLDPDKHQHGNMAGEDRRPIMAQIIEEGTGYDFGGNASIPRPFWDVVIRMLQDGSFDLFVEASFRKHGIQYIKSF